MSHADKLESFYLALNLSWGRPKGLGSGQLRESTRVGGKKAPPPPPDELTAEDWLRIIRLAENAGLTVPNMVEAQKLYDGYLEWYKEHQRIRLNLSQ